jgi:alcohol dehydrogenase
VVAAVGSQVRLIRPGDRVYVNPARGCGSCRACRGGAIADCRNFTYQGYFGRGELAQSILEQYPHGGLAEFMLAPQEAIVALPESVGFEEAARLGYLGTAYSALKKAGVGPARTVLINAIGGTLGLGGALLALAMGATRILGTGRNQALLDRVKAIAPARIEVLSVAGGAAIEDWARSLTGGEGVDAVIDCLPPRSPQAAVMAALRALRPGGRAIDVGASAEPLVLDSYFLKSRNATIGGSRWFTTAEGAAMAAMAGAGTLDLTVLEHRRFPLPRVNEAIAALGDANGGFGNFVVMP